ncbi:putative ribonuclease Z/Hydroxyacylglutathione hydrolase [Septoria linicola]|nr:putative ribonuclease Z/Hydroxyacylglutathione hydrolase [Septoria linicola]
MADTGTKDGVTNDDSNIKNDKDAKSQSPKARTRTDIEKLAKLTNAEIYAPKSGLNLSIDVYHINVEGKGDAAVHLLIHQDRAFTKPFVLRAVLIDGGLSTGAERIKAVLKKIGPLYDFDAQQGGRTSDADQLLWPPFDSIVITHWDEDHYAGVVQLLHDDLSQQYTQRSHQDLPILKPKATEADKKAYEALKTDYDKKLAFFTTTYLSPYMKYASPPKPAPPSQATKDTTAVNKPSDANTTSSDVANVQVILRAERALTVLFCPYFGSNTSVANSWNKQYPSAFFASTRVTNSAGFNAGVSCGGDVCGLKLKLWPFYSGGTDTRNSDGPNMSSRFLDFNAQERGAGLGPYDESTWARKLCRIRAGNRYLLGTNLFTHWHVDMTECYSIKNPLQLALAHATPASYTVTDPADPTLNSIKAGVVNGLVKHAPDEAQPMLLIVGANGDWCGQSVTAVSAKALDNEYRDEEPAAEQEPGITATDRYSNGSDPVPVKDTVSDEPQPSTETEGQQVDSQVKQLSNKSRLVPATSMNLPKFRIKVVDKEIALSGSELTNAASIITMAVWTDGHMSHYSAGDAQWDIENHIVDWIHSGGNPFQCIRAVKLSHHGSGYSTPLDLIRKFRPRSIIASASGHNFGHPVYELLIYLNRWFRTTNRIVPKGNSPGKLFHSLIYPYYLPRIDTETSSPKEDTSEDMELEANDTSGVNGTTKPMEIVATSDDPVAKPKKPIIIRKRVKLAYAGFEKNYWSSMLSSESPIVKAESARDKWVKSLKRLEGRLPPGERCLELYKTYRGQLVLQQAKKVYLDIDVQTALQNFTLAVVENGMPLIADWDPRSSDSVATMNAALGTLLPADDKVQYYKVHCRSWSQTRRSQDLDQRLDGYTDLLYEKSVPVLPGDKTAGNRASGGKRALTAATKEDKLEVERAKRQRALEDAVNKAGGTEYMRDGGAYYKRKVDEIDAQLAEIRNPSVGGKKKKQTKNDVFVKKILTPAAQNFKTLAQMPEVARLGSGDVNGSAADLHVESLATTDSIPVPVGPQVPQPETEAPKLYNLVPSTLVEDSPLRLDDSVVAISGAVSEYEKFLYWLSVPMFVVDGEGHADTDDAFRRHLVNAMSVDQDSSTLRATFVDKTNISDGSWTGLNLDCKQAGHQLHFSSANASSYFSSETPFATIPSFQVPATGLIMQMSTLVMALKPVAGTTEQWNITDILTWLGLLIESDTTDAISDLEDAIGAGIGFELVRGAVWFCPDVSYGVVQRMEWQLDSDSIRKWLAKGFITLGSDITVVAPTIVGRKTSRHSVTAAGDLFVDTYEILIALKLVRQVGSTTQDLTSTIQVNLEDGSSSLTICLLPSSGTFGDMLGWLSDLLGERDSSIGDIVNSIPGVKSLILKRVEIVCSRKGIHSFSIDVEWKPGWKNIAPGDDPAAGAEIPFLLTYRWVKASKPSPNSISAQIWYEPSHVRDPEAAPTELSPFYEPTKIIRPSLPAPSSVHLQSLMPGGYQLPKELSLVINSLVVTLEGRKISFSGQLVANKDSEADDTGFGIRLEEVTINASYERGELSPGQVVGKPNPKGESSYSLFLEAVVDITPEEEEEEARIEESSALDAESARTVIVAILSLEARGRSKVCRLHGSVQSLNLGILGRFFPAEDEQVITDLLGHVTLESLEIDYLYDSSGAGNEFDIGATLILGPCALDVDFHRDNEGWRFDAILQIADGTDAKVGALLGEILGDDDAALNSIPGFIKDMSLSGGAAFVSLKLASLDAASLTASASPPVAVGADSDLKFLMMNLTLRVPVPGGAGVELSFVQLTEKPALVAGRRPPPPQPGTLRNRTKRIIRVSVVDLPWHKIPNPPVVGKIEPLFDELQFLWVQDPVSNTGITRKEITIIGEISKIQFKDTFRQPKPEDNVLVSGMHFCIADGSKLLLDYAFNKPVTPGNARKAMVSKDNRPLPAPGAPTTSSSGDGTATAELSKKVGPIAVSNVGLRFEDGVLFLFLDIAAHLGPVQVMLLGFGIGINLKDFNLQKIYDTDPKFQLKGMGISFQQPPVGIAGMFKDASTATQRLYMGGVAISFKPYSFMAVGEYGEIARPGTTGMTDTFKTLFIFAKLEGPLIELEFVTIGGITLGFGYNSNLRFPTIAQVPSFPFISNSIGGGDTDPLTVMNQLVGAADSYVKSQEDSFWIAAGLRAKAFQALDVSAVVILESSPYVNLGIFAKAIAQMPPAPTPRIACFLYVELGLMCTVDFHAGAFRVEAQLSPNSFVIHPSCHLTGGFALCYWFGRSDYAGDFVFTVGGYHPVFKPPAHYPVPPRLGIAWQMGPVSIRGEAYFAITPTCCMGGGRLEVVFNSGLLCAYLTAYADFLIVYNPFFFKGEIGVCVGVRFTMDILFVTIHISVELNARLQLQGPEFGGSAYVDFWVFGFTIPFGARPKPPEKKNLDAFLDLLLQVPDADAVAQNAITGGNPASGQIHKLHVLSVEDGRYTNKKVKDGTAEPGEIWEVQRAGFQFRIQSRAPLQSITEPAASDQEADLIVQEENPFFSKPMQLTSQLQSSMTVTIAKIEKTGREVATFIPAPVIKEVPSALWGRYDASKDPSTGNIKASSILSTKDIDTSGTLPLLMGATFSAPLPFRSYDKILKYNVLRSSSMDVFTLADVDASGKLLHPTLPSTATICSGAWQAAEPVAGAMQWTFVKSKWQQAVQTKVDDEGGLGVVESAIDIMTRAMGWKVKEGSGLQNDLKTEKDTLLWQQFDHLYMAPPMIAVAA